MPTHASPLAGGVISVFVVDDHELVRRGLCEVLVDAGGIEIVGESGTAAEAVRRILAARPDVVLLDVRLPDGSGIEVCREVRSVDPSIRALMLTSYDDQDAVLESVMAGASAVALKQIRSPELVAAVRAVAAGRSPTTRTDPAALLGRLVPTVEPESEVAALSRQERRVLEGIVDGLTNREIGRRLDIAEQTVKNHVTTLLAKLGVERRTQAAVLGEQLRWHARTGPGPAGESGPADGERSRGYPRSPG